jgi:hypothetical protein
MEGEIPRSVCGGEAYSTATVVTLYLIGRPCCDVKEELMPALASLEELRKVDSKVKEFQAGFPEAYRTIAAILKEYRKIGYKNIIKLLLEESTPEKLKGAAG